MTREEFKIKYHGKKFYIPKFESYNFNLGTNGYPTLAQKLKYTSIKGKVSVVLDGWDTGIYLCQNMLEGVVYKKDIETFGYDHIYYISFFDFGYLNLKLIDREDKLKRILNIE